MFRSIIIFSTLIVSTLANAQLSYHLSNKFWRLRHATINGQDYNFGSGDNAPTLQFSGGSIRGNGGCNAYHTKFTINGTVLAVDKVMSTRMACNDLTLNESEYFDALSKTHRLEYQEGTNEFRLVNFNNDILDFYVQFERSPSSYTPPVERHSSYSAHSSRYDGNSSAPKLSKKQLARKRDLEKKLKKKKLTKAERRELIVLQSKEKKATKVSRSKKGKHSSVRSKGRKHSSKKANTKSSKKSKASKAKKTSAKKKKRR